MTVSEDGNVPCSPSFAFIASASPSRSPPCAGLDEDNQNISLEKQKFFRSCPFYRGGRNSLSSSMPGDSTPLPLPLPSPKPGSSMASLITSISKSYLARPRRTKLVQNDEEELWGFAAAAARKSPLPVKSFIKPPTFSQVTSKAPSSSIVKPSVINFEAIKSCTLKPPTLTFDELRNSKSGSFGHISPRLGSLFNGLTSHSFHTSPGPGGLFPRSEPTVETRSPPHSNPYNFPNDPEPILSSCLTPRVGNEKPPPGKLTSDHFTVCCY